jgi:RNA polymerase sigma factor (TIGR02999 family)
VTELLAQWGGGDREALDRLMPLVYDELRRIADSHFRRERADHTLQPTALINEVYLRLIGENSITWQSRAHFLGVAAHLMRFILIDHARARKASKRGGEAERVMLDEAIGFFKQKDLDLIALDAALGKLAGMDERQAQIVELKFFGGLSIEEIAEVTGVSPATVKREWSMAKAWLHKELSGHEQRIPIEVNRDDRP